LSRYTGQVFSLDRRHFLVSAAALPAASIVPGVKRAEAAASDVVQSSPMTLTAEPANFSAATARRLIEIAHRNDIRREANLALLSIAKELRAMNDGDSG
jgi:hypothetical protein